MERGLVSQYEAWIEELLLGLTPQNHGLAVQIANLPEHIRGFGHIKLRSVASTSARAEELLKQWRIPASGLERAA